MQSLSSKQPLSQLRHAQQSSGQQSPGARVRILLVDDEIIFARAVAKWLQHAGYDCFHAQTLSAGHELASQLMPDLVILDLSLPDGDGIALLPYLSAIGVSVVVISASDDLIDADQLIQQGDYAFLQKPLDLAMLLRSVQQALLAHPLQNSG